MASASFEEASENFLRWFKSLPGAEFSSAIKIVDLRDRNAGRGIIATEDIAPETTLFTIPRRGIINVETSALPGKIPDVFDLEADNEDGPQMDAWSSLILVMLYEFMLGEASAWKAYFDVLPAAFDTPMFWSEDELAVLQTSHVRGKIGKQDAEAMFRERLVPVIRAHAELFEGSEKRSDEELVELAHRMGSTIMAYAFDLEGDEEPEDEGADGWVEDREGKSMLGMVPMADILNADAEFNAHVNHGEDSLTVTALRPIKAGEEILNYYGPHPNSELLRRYGYVTERHSRYDVVEIPWEVVESVMKSEYNISEELLGKIRNALEEEEEFEDTFVLERENPDVNPDGTFSGPSSSPSLPEDLCEQLKTFLKAIKKASPEAIPDKRKRDEMQGAVLGKTLQALLTRYSTSIAEDERLLREEGLGKRERMAVEVRVGEKRLLVEAMGAGEDVEMEDGGEGERQKRVRV